MAVVLPTNEDGSLRPFTPEEIEAMEIETRGVEDGSHPSTTRRPGGCTWTRAFFCAGDKLDNFLVHMLGAVKTFDDSGTMRLSRLPPQKLPGRDRVVCMQLESATGHRFVEDDPDGVPTWEKWHCVFTYEQVMFDVAADDDTPHEWLRYLQTLPSQSNVQQLEMPHGTIRYIRRPTDPDPAAAPHGKSVPYGFTRTQAESIVSKKWWRLSREVWNEGSELYKRFHGNVETGERPWINTVNSHECLGYPRGTLQLLTPEEEVLPDPVTDEEVVNLTIRFLFRSDGINWMWYSDPTGNATGLYFVGRGTTHHTSDDLPDNYSVVDARDHRDLWKVGALT